MASPKSNNQAIGEPKGPWTCQSCETVNPHNGYFCQKCYLSQDGKTKLSEAARRRVQDTIKTLTNQSGLPAAATAAAATASAGPSASESTGQVYTSTLPTGPSDMNSCLLTQTLDPLPVPYFDRFMPTPSQAYPAVVRPPLVTQPLIRNPNKPATERAAHSSTPETAGLGEVEPAPTECADKEEQDREIQEEYEKEGSLEG